MKKIISLISGISLGILLLSNGVQASQTDAANTLATKGVITSQSSSAWYKLWSQITRKEIMKVVMNLSGKSVTDSCNKSFSDVEADWGCKYIESALSHGFIAKNPTFRPNDSITKAESLKLILKARWIEKAHNTWDWRQDYMLTAYGEGVISSKYSDHDTKALRGWIFSASVWEEKVMKDEMAKDETIKSTWGYKAYSADMVWTSQNVVIFFHAIWCPSCVAADKALSWENFEWTDTLVLQADFDSSTELRKKYWVTSQHTFVQIDTKGELVKKWVWWRSLSDIEEKLK